MIDLACFDDIPNCVLILYKTTLMELPRVTMECDLEH